MTCRTKCTQFYLVMELMIDICLDGIADAICLLSDTAIPIKGMLAIDANRGGYSLECQLAVTV